MAAQGKMASYSPCTALESTRLLFCGWEVKGKGCPEEIGNLLLFQCC